MDTLDDMMGGQDDMVDALDAPKEFEGTSHIGSQKPPI